MSIRLRAVAPLAPALGLLAFATWLGTFHGAAGGVQAMLAHGLLLGVLAWTLPTLPAVSLPWLALAWIAVAVPTFLSPVPRAGLSVVALLPAFLVLPWAVARLWRGERRRILGLRAVLVVVALVAAVSLLAWWREGTPGTSMPLGHHNLLAAWLVTLLPLAALGPRVGWRWALPAAILGSAALLATSSLTGLVAISAAAAAWLLGRHPAARSFRVGAVSVLSFVVFVLLAIGGDRLVDLLGGRDPSFLARRGYVEAAWRGALERPWSGWGAGATHWTLAEHLRPVPGVHPPGEIVADAHALPVQLLYELGFPSCALLLVAGWGLSRPTRPEISDCEICGEDVRRASSAGLVAFGVATLGGLDLGVTALPVAVALVCGLRLALREEDASELDGADRVDDQPRRRPSWLVVSAGVVFAGLLALWQLPRDRAHLDYERARLAEGREQQLRRLERATARDPAMPLYRWRRAMLEQDAGLALEAARDASGLAALWLTAGEQARSAGDVETARLAYVRACDLDPLGAVAPFRLATLDERPGPETAARTARALLAEPRLLAAADWPDGRLASGVELLLELDGVDPGWRVTAADAFHAVQDLAPGGETLRLGLRADAVAGESSSLFAFRRRPWPVVLARIELRRAALERIDLPPASTLTLTHGEVFAPGCRVNGG